MIIFLIPIKLLKMNSSDAKPDRLGQNNNDSSIEEIATGLKPRKLFTDDTRPMYKYSRIIHWILLAVSIIAVTWMVHLPEPQSMNHNITIYNPQKTYVDRCCFNNRIFLSPQCKAHNNCDFYLKAILQQNYTDGIQNCCYDIKSPTYTNGRYCSYYCLSTSYQQVNTVGS